MADQILSLWWCRHQKWLKRQQIWTYSRSMWAFQQLLLRTLWTRSSCYNWWDATEVLWALQVSSVYASKTRSVWYGIKYWILADAESHYCFNAISYLGKEGDTPAVNLGATVVTKPVEPICNTHQNVTIDCFFTSFDLFEDLHRGNLSAVGTVKANRKSLPVKLLPSQAKERTVGDSIFAFKENTTMVSWYPKWEKVVLLLWAMHHDDRTGDSGKPELVEFFKTKAGVDALDQKVRHYTTSQNKKMAACCVL